MKRGPYQAKEPTARPKLYRRRKLEYVPIARDEQAGEGHEYYPSEPNIITEFAKALAKEKNKRKSSKSKPKALSHTPASMNKPAHYTLARENIMCAYTLLCPNEMSVDELRNHLEEITYQSSFSRSLDTQRTLFFEAFDALEAGLKGTWFRKD